MRNSEVAVLLVLAILAGAGAGYFVGSQKITTTTSTIQCPSATTQAYSSDFGVEISYQGPWNATIGTYSAFATTPATLLLACHYRGSGFAYVGVASPNPNGEQTVVGAVRKLDSSNGNLTVTVTYGAVSRSNSTTFAFGSVTAFVSTAP
jgi:hypothetical protein